jgi:ribosomal protein S18 acetylase RimI-like enzyme
MKGMRIEIREYAEQDRAWARDLLKQRWGSSSVVSRGKMHHADRLPGFIAYIDDMPQGLVTYRVENRECEIVTLDALVEGRGLGRELLSAVRKIASAKKCNRVWLITTNDNERAQEFYKKSGFELVAVHKNAIQESRNLKPELPDTCINGIPIRDEIEFELAL